MLQRTNATTKSFINKIRMLQRTELLQRTWRNTIVRRSTRVHMTCRTFLFLIRVSAIIFVIICKVQLSAWFSYLLICVLSSENIFLITLFFFIFFILLYIFPV